MSVRDAVEWEEANREEDNSNRSPGNNPYVSVPLQFVAAVNRLTNYLSHAAQTWPKQLPRGPRQFPSEETETTCSEEVS